MSHNIDQYFYSGQIRRFLAQFIRLVSGFQVAMGKNNLGIVSYQQVPVIYGDTSRQVAQIIANNSENSTPTVPAFSVYISSLDYDRERMQSPSHVSSLHLQERRFDTNTNEYTSEPGDKITVERLMPVPYKLGLTLDVWASNTDQKLQMIEQFAPMFNPSIELQNTDNYVDWTSLSTVTLETTKWTTKSVPVGANDVIDVTTFNFTMPIWLTSPAKVKKLSAIHSITDNIYTDDGSFSDQIIDASSSVRARVVVRPIIGVIYTGNTLKLLQDRTVASSDTTSKPPTSWQALFALYGVYQPGITQVRLMLDTGTELIGTVAIHPSDDSLLIYSPFGATMPANTLSPVNAIVDPRTVKVSSIPTAPGSRLLILNDIGSSDNLTGAIAWKGTDNSDLIAKENDIIEYNGTNWFVSFSPTEDSSNKYFTNLTSNEQYKWDGTNWVKSVHGAYHGGQVRIVI